MQNPNPLNHHITILLHFLRARYRWTHLRGPTLARFQARRAQAIVRYAQQHAPYYHQLWTGHDLRAWRSLPTVDKQAMMANFDHFNTRGVRGEAAMRVALASEQSRDFQPTLGGLTVGLSSGTSGHRGLFLVSPAEQAAWAGTILARTIHQLRRRPYRVAFFLRSNSNLYEQVGGRLVQFRYFDLMTPLEQAVSALNHFQPNIVVGPPSLLGLLADAAEEGRLRIVVERLVSVAEVLEPQDRERLAHVFAAPVHQIYQCTEGLLAISCKLGALHVQEDIVALQFEPLGDGDDRVVPIVTDLWRKTQPIIRYRLNDVLRLDPAPCACGSTFGVIQSIEGRCDDVCYFVGNDGQRRPFFPDTIRRMILLAHPDILDYQAVQAGDGQLAIHLAVATHISFEEVAAAVHRSVQAMVAHYACQLASVSIGQGLPPMPQGTKRRRVRRIPS